MKNQTPVSQTYKDIFDAKFENVGASITRAQEHLLRTGVSEDVSSICMLAVSEALNNVVEHSYPEEYSGFVELVIRINKTSILFQVRDCGRTPPEGLFSGKMDMPDPFDLPEGGWGLALISSVMDDVGFSNKDGFNELNLVKKLAPELSVC